jgi:hypothetical protein
MDNWLMLLLVGSFISSYVALHLLLLEFPALISTATLAYSLPTNRKLALTSLSGDLSDR